jgi:LPPG:FO 2-phospho-L-lactate transferase
LILALAGGVGGAKLAHGLAQVLRPEELLIVVNTADDFEHLGLAISPDLDTVMYTLAGIANPETGWGQAGETWEFMAALSKLGGPDWFRLGDRDLATHVERTRRRAAGEPLSAITRELCRRLGVNHIIAPMSDDPVRTLVRTETGTLAFQEYFVRDRCAPVVRGFQFAGAEQARPSQAFGAALASSALEGVVLCPSNPYISIDPILAIPGVRDAIRACRSVVAVSPIVGGEALKGPAAKMMRELGANATALGVARHYRDLVGRLVLDQTDAALAGEVRALGMQAEVRDTVMTGVADRTRLARECIRLVRGKLS